MKNGILVFLVLASGCASKPVERMPSAEHEAFLAKAAAATTLEERWNLGVEARLKAGLGFGYFAALRENGRTITRAAGKRTLEPVTKISERDLLEIGSVTKTFTGILLHLAEIEGKFSLDAKLETVLSELKGTEAGEVTFRELGLHRSGLPRNPTGLGPDSENPWFRIDRDAFVAELAKAKRTPVPQGETRKREYSNLGFIALGVALERVYQRSYFDLVRNRIFSPLGMKESGFDLKVKKRRKSVPKAAPGFSLAGDVRPHWDFDSFVAATGGIESNARDLAKFLEAFEKPPAGKLGQAIEAGMDSGIGWDSNPGEAPLWKNGMTGTQSAILVFDRKAKRGFFIGTNTRILPDDLGLFVLGTRPQDDLLLKAMPKRVPSAEEVSRLIGSFRGPSRSVDVFETFGHLVSRYSFPDGKTGTLVVPDERENVWSVLDGRTNVDKIRVLDTGMRITTAFYDEQATLTELKKISTEPEKYPALER